MAETQNHSKAAVILHGIGHSCWSMVTLERILKRNGYRTFNLTYPSRKHGIKELAIWLDGRLSSEKIWKVYDEVNFVGHSMGGLVIGAYLNKYKSDFMTKKMGRVVMLGTPHGGSEVADFLQQYAIYKYVFGPAGLELTTNARAAEKIKPWYNLGMIAGDRNWLYPLGWFCIKTKNDGCVNVKSTMLDGMTDHIVLLVMHGFMGWSPVIHRQVVCFLQNGRFLRL